MHSVLNSHTVFRGALLALLLAPLAPVAGAAPAEAYGESFARSDRAWRDGRPGGAAGAVAPPAPAVAEPAQEQAWVAALEQYEIQEGPYADALAEPLASLARSFHARGELDRARALYRRALHIVRVNDGLYSQRQVPLVRALLNTYRETGDYAALDERYEYLYRLYGAGQPPYSELRLRAALEYLRWQREALRRELDESDRRRLLGLLETNADLIDALREHGPVPFPLYREVVLSQLRNLYLLEQRVEPTLLEEGVSFYNPLPDAAGQGDRDFNTVRLEALQRRAGSEATELLDDLALRAGAEGPVEQARVALERADWHQWQGSSRRANEHYARAESLLLQAGEQELLRRELGAPRELPDNGAFWQQGNGESPQRVRVRFDVSERGRARNIETHSVPPEQVAAARKLRRALAGTRFRPAFSGGLPRAVNDVQTEYEVY